MSLFYCIKFLKINNSAEKSSILYHLIRQYFPKLLVLHFYQFPVVHR